MECPVLCRGASQCGVRLVAGLYFLVEYFCFINASDAEALKHLTLEVVIIVLSRFDAAEDVGEIGDVNMVPVLGGSAERRVMLPDGFGEKLREGPLFRYDLAYGGVAYAYGYLFHYRGGADFPVVHYSGYPVGELKVGGEKNDFSQVMQETGQEHAFHYFLQAEFHRQYTRVVGGFVAVVPYLLELREALVQYPPRA